MPVSYQSVQTNQEYVARRLAFIRDLLFQDNEKTAKLMECGITTVKAQANSPTQKYLERFATNLWNDVIAGHLVVNPTVDGSPVLLRWLVQGHKLSKSIEQDGAYLLVTLLYDLKEVPQKIIYEAAMTAVKEQIRKLVV